MLIGLLTGETAFAQREAGAPPRTATEPWQAPTLTNTRYDEHYESLAGDAAREAHWTDRFKYIPLGDGDRYLTTGVELRARSEMFRNNLWGSAPAPDDGYLWLRALPYADLHAGRVRTFVQPVAAYAVGVAPSPSPIDQTRVDLLQAFVDLRLGNAGTGRTDADGVTLRAGRQMISLGSERLIGTRYGPNVPLTFDGFRALISVRGAVASLLAVRPVQAGASTFDDRRSRMKSLYGAYVMIPEFGQSSGLDVYWLGYHNAAVRFDVGPGSERRYSLGARLYGKSDGWHWNVEGVYQFGRFASRSISAWTLGSEVGRQFDSTPLTPDVMVRFNVVSGDRDPGDRRLGTFNAMFPKGKYFGELSPVGPTNIISVNPRTAVALSPTVSATLGGSIYWRYSLGDGVYDIAGSLVRGAGSTTARYIGSEGEVTVSWHATPELELSTSLSAFAPGGFVRQSGPARTITLFGLEANFRF